MDYLNLEHVKACHPDQRFDSHLQLDRRKCNPPPPRSPPATTTFITAGAGIEPAQSKNVPSPRRQDCPVHSRFDTTCGTEEKPPRCGESLLSLRGFVRFLIIPGSIRIRSRTTTTFDRWDPESRSLSLTRNFDCPGRPY